MKVRHATSACAAAALGAAAAVAVSGGIHTTASTADDIPVYTATTPTVYTSTTPDTFQAARIEFYRATIIKKLPPAAPIKRIAGRGGSFSLPANCSAACALYAWVITDNIAGWLLDARSGTLGKARKTVAAGGPAKLKLKLAPRWRRAALRSKKPLRVKVRMRIVDSRYGFTKQRVQRVILRP